jgi:pentapeptide MXKDX repeat protein
MLPVQLWRRTAMRRYLITEGRTMNARCVALLLGLVWCGASGEEPVAPADTSQGEEIRWEEAAREVDTFPFSSSFIDSVRNEHGVSLSLQPLRRVLESVMFAPETLVYKVGWGPFNAGYVVLSTLYDSANGTVQIGAKALSNNFVGAFYRMRDYVISTVDAYGLYPLFFEQHLREGKRYRSNEYLLFDHVGEKVHVQSRKHFKTVEAPPFLHDYLSVLYAIRSTRVLAPGDTFTEPLFVHNKVDPIFFTVKASKPREVDAGKFSCIILVPRLVGEGRAFNKRDKLEIWLSDDRRRMPVAIRSKIKFGAINARLIWYSTPHTQSMETQSSETKSTDSLSTDSLSTDSLSTDSLSTDSLSTDSLSTDSLSTDSLSTDSLSTDSLSTDSLSTDSQSTDTLSTDER